ncbi:RHS repeat-associated core domain-containing protein [Pseudomonas sp. NBRC 111124]|uniref:RHS repeat-associated core domain-containing protein n=1 Tax=Pseudomonas sp. NBRC 111124 TaxID=1661039 RepID=UPI000761AE7E|nr:RHS repeat-associated core domain-containing protein [Pseudomonas sp. NBRC 111124]
MTSIVQVLNRNTPTGTVTDNRGLTVRTVEYLRRPDKPEVTDQRITYHQFNARGVLIHSIDPRLAAVGWTNFNYLTGLAGSTRYTRSVDAGISMTIDDVAGRPLMALSQSGIDPEGSEDRSQAVTRTWQYESRTLSGRLLSVTERLAYNDTCVTERFIWAGTTPEEQVSNLVGHATSHYDPAGLVETTRIALSGVPISVTRRLLKFADNPDTVANWQGEEIADWNARLGSETYRTLTMVDALGAALTKLDAMGNLQRMAYDVAGQFSGSWLTIKGSAEQTVVKRLSFAATGRRLREEHGNGVLTFNTYEAMTQRLSSILTERPPGHASGAKVLQDLHYAYDPVGNVIKLRNDVEATRFWRNQKVAPESEYAYDTLYQLVKAIGREMANAGQQTSLVPSFAFFDSTIGTQYTRTFCYDDAGNLTHVRHSAPATNNSYTTDIIISDRSNRGVLSNLAKDPAAVDALFTPGGQQVLLLPGQRLDWTPRAELRQVSSIMSDGAAKDTEHYHYDGNSQRVLKVGIRQTVRSLQSQRVIYLPGLELRTLQRGENVMENLQVVIVGESPGQVRLLYWEAGQPAEVENNQLRYSHENLLGSSALEVDGDGKLISQEEYYPFGGTALWAARNEVEAGYKTVRYSGKERDATGLYYYGYRYYQPWVGRWLGSDPAGPVDGLNLFCMVNNNPVVCVDLDGRVTLGNSSTEDGALLVDLFENGHILYGLRSSVASAMGKIITARLNPDGRNSRESVEFHAQAQITDAVWDAKISATKYKPDDIIQELYNDAGRVLGFKRFLNAHPKYNVRAQRGARQLEREYSKVIEVGLWKRTSKAGLEYQLISRMAPVHFLMDGINIGNVASKRGDGGQSVTAGELRWLYRHRDVPEVRENLFFHREGKEIAHAEVFGSPEWQAYSPRRQYRQSSLGNHGVNRVFGRLMTYARSKFR